MFKLDQESRDFIEQNVLEALIELGTDAAGNRWAAFDDIRGKTGPYDSRHISALKSAARKGLVTIEDECPTLAEVFVNYAITQAGRDKFAATRKRFLCTHNTRGRYECHAETPDAAKKRAAAHWGLVSPTGVNAYLASIFSH